MPPRPVQKEIAMSRQRFALPHLSPILVLSVLVLCVPVTWAQEHSWQIRLQSNLRNMLFLLLLFQTLKRICFPSMTQCG